MRVAADQLRRDSLGHVVDVERPVLPGHLGVEHHLEQEIAQLLAEQLRSAGVDGLEGLVRLLEQMAGQRPMGLLPVPGAAAWPAQPVHDLEQVQQPVPAGPGRNPVRGAGVAHAAGQLATSAVESIGQITSWAGSNRPNHGFTEMSELFSCRASHAVKA